MLCIERVTIVRERNFMGLQRIFAGQETLHCYAERDRSSRRPTCLLNLLCRGGDKPRPREAVGRVSVPPHSGRCGDRRLRVRGSGDHFSGGRKPAPTPGEPGGSQQKSDERGLVAPRVVQKVGRYAPLRTCSDYFARGHSIAAAAREATDWSIGRKSRRASPASYAALVSGEAPL